MVTLIELLPEWEWIFKLRTASGAYPQMVNLMKPVEAEFKGWGWI